MRNNASAIMLLLKLELLYTGVASKEFRNSNSSVFPRPTNGFLSQNSKKD